MKPFSTLHFLHQIEPFASIKAAKNSDPANHSASSLKNISSTQLCTYVMTTLPYVNSIYFLALEALLSKTHKDDLSNQDKVIQYLLTSQNSDTFSKIKNFRVFEKLLTDIIQSAYSPLKMKLKCTLLINKLLLKPVNTDNINTALLSFPLRASKTISHLEVFLTELSATEINLLFDKSLTAAKSTIATDIPLALIALAKMAPRLNPGFQGVIIEDLAYRLKGKSYLSAFEMFVNLFPIASVLHQEKIIFHLISESAHHSKYIKEEAVKSLCAIYCDVRFPIPDSVLDHILQNLPSHIKKTISPVLAELFPIVRASYKKRIVQKLIQFTEEQNIPDNDLAITIKSLGEIYCYDENQAIWAAIFTCNEYEQSSAVTQAINNVLVSFFPRVPQDKQKQILDEWLNFFNPNALIQIVPHSNDIQINLIVDAVLSRYAQYINQLNVVPLLGALANKGNLEARTKIIGHLTTYLENTSATTNETLAAAYSLATCFHLLIEPLKTNTVDALLKLSKNESSFIRSMVVTCFLMMYKLSGKNNQIKISYFINSTLSDTDNHVTKNKIAMLPTLFNHMTSETQEKTIKILLEYLKDDRVIFYAAINALKEIYLDGNDTHHMTITEGLLKHFKRNPGNVSIHFFKDTLPKASHDEIKLILEAMLPIINKFELHHSVRYSAHCTIFNIIPLLSLDELAQTRATLIPNSHDTIGLIFSMRIFESKKLESKKIEQENDCLEPAAKKQRLNNF